MTLAYAAHLFERNRHALYADIQHLTDAQLLLIPAGFENNIAWNLGHIIGIQQGLVYSRSGLPPHVDLAEMQKLYWVNTSPADWTEAPDPRALVTLLLAHAEQLLTDIDAGTFANVTYAPRTSGSGITCNTVAEAVYYNNTHEALHRGAILALKDFVTR